MQNKQRRADLLLVMVTLFWGSSYFLSDYCMQDMGPLNLNAFRFLVGFLVLGLAFRKHLWPIRRSTAFYSLLIGLALTGTYVLYGYAGLQLCPVLERYCPVLEMLL